MMFPLPLKPVLFVVALMAAPGCVLDDPDPGLVPDPYAGLAQNDLRNGTCGQGEAVGHFDQLAPKIDAPGFGSVVATDGVTVAVGSPSEGGLEPQTQDLRVGAVYVYENNNADVQRLESSSPQDAEQFGGALALSGNTLVVGAFGNNSDAIGSGAAYIFSRGPTGWRESQIVTDSTPYPNVSFGIAVAVSKDENTLVVGASDANAWSGLVYVFERKDGRFVEQAVLSGSVGSAVFGSSVAIDSEGSTIVVGAKRDGSGAPSGGSVFIFERKGDNWLKSQFTPEDTRAGDWLGQSVSIANNIIVASAPNADYRGAEDVGAVYALQRIKGEWIQQNKLYPIHVEAFSHFGNHIAVDDSQRLVVRASGSRMEGVPGQLSLYSRCSQGAGWYGHVLESNTEPLQDAVKNSVAIGGELVLVGSSRTADNPANVEVYEAVTAVVGL